MDVNCFCSKQQTPTSKQRETTFMRSHPFLSQQRMWDIFQHGFIKSLWHLLFCHSTASCWQLAAKKQAKKILCIWTKVGKIPCFLPDGMFPRSFRIYSCIHVVKSPRKTFGKGKVKFESWLDKPSVYHNRAHQLDLLPSVRPTWRLPIDARGDISHTSQWLAAMHNSVLCVALVASGREQCVRRKIQSAEINELHAGVLYLFHIKHTWCYTFWAPMGTYAMSTLKG